MGSRSARTGLVGALALVAVGCGAGHSSSGPTSSASASSASASLAPTASGSPRTSAPTPSGPTSAGSPCATSDAAEAGGCWRELLPLGSGGFPASPGSQDQPLWQPGRFPLTLTPRLAFHGELWMTAQTLTYSAPDGLTWTQHDETDWGERIYQSITYFRGKLWLFGGLDYQARTFLNDIWSSSDGTTWAKAGTAAWTPRLPGQDLDLQRQAHRRHRQLGRRPLADDSGGPSLTAVAACRSLKVGGRRGSAPEHWPARRRPARSRCRAPCRPCGRGPPCRPRSRWR